jgi:hypothetical protein
MVYKAHFEIVEALVGLLGSGAFFDNKIAQIE